MWTCAMRYDKPRPLRTSLSTTHWWARGGHTTLSTDPVLRRPSDSWPPLQTSPWHLAPRRAEGPGDTYTHPLPILSVLIGSAAERPSLVGELQPFSRRSACIKSAVARAFRRVVAVPRARAPRPVAPRLWAPRAAPSAAGSRAGLPFGCPARDRHLRPHLEAR